MTRTTEQERAATYNAAQLLTTLYAATHPTDEFDRRADACTYVQCLVPTDVHGRCTYCQLPPICHEY